MRTPIVLTSLLLLVSPAAQADVWTDPIMGNAILKADLIVRARAPAEGSKGKPTVSFAVEKALLGKAPSPVIEVGGLHDPAQSSGPEFAPNQIVYLILGNRDGGWRVPTPTMGRFPVRNGKVQYVTLRDTYLRLAFEPADFEAYVNVFLKRVDQEWLAGLRKHLSSGSPTDTDEARAHHYLALETLSVEGKKTDVRAILKFLPKEPTGPFQLRISACRALRTAAGTSGAGHLLRVARSDPEPLVRTIAINALGRLDPPPSGLVERLAELLDKAPADTIRMSGPNDPRLNKFPSPKAALLAVIGGRGAKPVRGAVLRVLDQPQVPLEVFSAALRCLITLEGDPKLPRELVNRFRGEGEVGAALYNRELCAALARFTGANLGEEPDLWRAWVKKPR